MAGNVDGLLLCWNFINVSRQQEPIEKLLMELITNAQMNSVPRILADGRSNVDCFSVRQHSSKPNVVRSCFGSNCLVELQQVNQIGIFLFFNKLFSVISNCNQFFISEYIYYCSDDTQKERS